MAFQIAQNFRYKLWQPRFDAQAIGFATHSIWFFFCIFIIPARGFAAAENQDANRIALMVEIDNVTSHSPQLVNAIRAQLSASQIFIQNVTVQTGTINMKAPQISLRNLARQFDAQFVFFIVEAPESCNISFYIEEESNNELYVRQLPLQSSNNASRFETIANAVSSLLEDATTGPLLKPAPRQQATSAPVAPKTRVSPNREKYYSVVSAFYKGTVFSKSHLAHGIGISLGVLPLPGFVIGISYNHNFMLKWNTESYQFLVRSGDVAASIAKRVVKNIFEFQSGISFNTSFRSYSVNIRDDTLSLRRPDSNAIFAIEPFGEIAWHFHKNIWLQLRAGASVALNEKRYLVSQNGNSPKVAVSPYRVKPTYSLGFVIQL